MTGSGRARAVVAGYCALLALLIVGPLAGSGYLLLRDAVSTPRSYLTDSALGLGAAAPRAVPQDTLLAVLSPVIDGGLLVKAILVVALWSAGYGAAVLARDFLAASTPAQLVAATLALWNPYVAERLLQGHWSLLAGYAALPWAALAAVRLRHATRPRAGATDRRLNTAAEANPSGPDGPDAGPAGPDAGPAGPGPEAGPAGLGASATSGPTAGPSGPSTEPSKAGAGDTSGDATGSGRGRLAVGESRSGISLFRGGRLRTSPRLAAGRGSVGAWAALVASFAAAGLTPTGSLLVAIVGLALVGRRAFLPAAALWLATCAPWLTATALGAGADPSDPAGVAAFAARAEPWLGTLGSLAGLGGIWNSEAVPASRTTPLALVGTVLLLGIVALGARTVWGLGRSGRTLLVIAAAAVVLPALGATGVGLATGEWLVVHVPGAGLLRDTQKYVALAMPAYALCAAAGCQVVGAWLRHYSTAARSADRRDSDTYPSTTASPTRNTTVAAVFIALLILPLADLAWGIGGEMRPVHYPGGWEQAVEHMDGPGDVAVLPAGMFRKFPYSGTAPVLDPAPRILPNDVLQTGELHVRGHAVTGEGNRARTVEDALLRGAPSTELAALGVGWILVERTTPGPLGEAEKTLTTAEPTYQDADLALYRIAAPTLRDVATPTHRAISLTAHLLWALLLLTSLTTAAVLHPYQRSVARRSASMSQNTPTE
ncbi:hypothetical protein [Nocardia asteroides]|uniref:hypothetical protein n=1 Tax=Nocardia asteroides TaxID=1824 RepID=UPI003F57AC9A